MLKEAIEKIQQMSKDAEVKVIDVNGDKYATQEIYSVEPKEYRPSKIQVNSLESIIMLVRKEAVKYTDKNIFVQVEDAKNVSVFTTYDEKNRRDFLYHAKADVVDIPVDYWVDKDNLLISINSVFIQSEDVDYVKELLNRVTEESKVVSTDNGLGQSVEVNKGIALKDNIQIRNRVKLRPYRTFIEIEQPESEFILRADSGARFLLKSADGGAWQLKAKESIKAHLEESLRDLESVIIMA